MTVTEAQPSHARSGTRRRASCASATAASRSASARTGTRSSGSAATRTTRRRRATRARRRCAWTTTRTVAASGSCTRCAGAPTGRSRRSTGTPRCARWRSGWRGARRPRRRQDPVLRRRRTGQPPVRRLRRGAAQGFGGKYRSSAVAQEKSGEVWVNGAMFGNAVRGEFDECEVAFFIGKNPYQSHSIPHARTTLKAIANDPDRSMVVIDPRRHRDRRAGRLPPPGRAGPRRLAARRDGRDHRPGGLARRRLAGRARQRPRRGRCPVRHASTSPSTARSPASTRTSCAGRRGASRQRRASPCSRTSASR